MAPFSVLKAEDEDEILLDAELDASGGVAVMLERRANAERRRRLRYAAAGCAVLVLAALLLGVGLSSVSGGADGGGDDDDPRCAWAEYRLPAEPAPTHYELALALDLAAPFDAGGAPPAAAGTVRIDLAPPSEPVKCVVLHAAADEVTVTSVALGSAPAAFGNGSVPTQLVIELPGGGIAGGEAAYLDVAYTVPLHPGLRGVYLSEYDEGKFLVSTQLEATDARRMLPCFDEPGFKATFGVTLDVPRAAAALANGAEVSRSPLPEPRNGLPYDRRVFARTPPMSTYLLAIAVGELQGASAVSKDTGVNVTAWCVPFPDPKGERAAALVAARDAALAILPAYVELFGAPFPFPKLDLIALPDFAAGAMENWAAITFRETALLALSNSGASGAERVAVVVAHEMAHQWFGDYVTMEWWDGLWLNEGFASYIEHVGTDVARPEYGFLSEGFFYAGTAARALRLDALESSHAVQADDYVIEVDGDIDALFDGVSYDKGGSLLRMLRLRMAAGDDGAPSALEPGLTKPDPFIRGIQEYVRAHALGNARTEDLWSALAAAPCAAGFAGCAWRGDELVSAMRGWTTRKGYPLVKVERAADGGGWTVRQAHFTALEGADFDAPGFEPWRVPLRVRAVGGGLPTVTDLTGRSGRVFGDSATTAHFNADGVGFYRVQYQPEHWDALFAALPGVNLTAGDAASLVSDAEALVDAGLEPVGTLLRAVEAAAARRPVEYATWRAVYGAASALRSRLAQPCGARVDEWAAGLAGPATASAGFGAVDEAADSHSLRRARLYPLRLAGLAGDPAALDWASENAEDAHPDVESAVYALAARGAARSGDDAAFDAFLERRDAAAARGDALEASRLLDAVCGAGGNWTAPALDLSLDDRVRAQDAGRVVSCVAGAGPAERDAAWAFLESRWDDLEAKVGGVGAAAGGLGGLVSRVASGFVDPARPADVEALFAAHPDSDVGLHKKQALEAIAANQLWMELNGAGACGALA